MRNCGSKVECALEDAGASDITIDLATKLVSFRFDGARSDAIAAVQQAGFDVPSDIEHE